MTQRTCLHRLVVVTVVVIGSAFPARADIFQWEYINPADPSQGKQQSTMLAPGGAGVDAVPGANLSLRNLTMAYLVGADLTSASASFADLTDADLSHANLSGAYFNWAALDDADLTGAVIKGATFQVCDPLLIVCRLFGSRGGITLAQLYSTASYEAQDLSGIGLILNKLAGANFAGQNLENANFGYATLIGANFRQANLANANFHTGDACEFPFTCVPPGTHFGADFTSTDARGASFRDLSDAITTNMILPDGHIDGLDLDAGGLLIVRDYDGDPRYTPASPPIPIRVDQQMAIGPDGTLRMVFEADAWDSTISFAPGIPVTLGGTLELTFADDVNLASQIGRTFDLFDWTGVTPTGTFAISSPYTWNLSNLYTTGDVTLMSVPEPGTLLLLSFGLIALLPMRRIALRNRALPMATAMLPLVGLAVSAHADIYEWEYIDPADPSQGKQQSITLAPDGAGVDAVPGAYLAYRNLTMAYLIGADLAGATGNSANLTNADLNQANLSNANLDFAALTNADFTNAQVQGAYLQHATDYGFTAAQLYSTVSYKAHDLTGIRFDVNDLSGWNFTGQNLTNASFWAATLTDADFTGAEVRGADLNGTGITLMQLYSTASYQTKDLTGVVLLGNDLTAGNFARQNLTNAGFDNTTLTGANFREANLTNATLGGATLTDADFTDADVLGAFFSAGGIGLTTTQLYSTASYQAHDLTGIGLSGNLTSWNFAGQKLNNARFNAATLKDADLTGADVRGTDFTQNASCLFNLPICAPSTNGINPAQLYSTASYQAHDLSGINLSVNDLSGVNFAGQNLTNAGFAGAALTDADFTGAEIRGTSFHKVNWNSCRYLACFDSLVGTGITLDQLYSTASYRARDLSGISFGNNNLVGGNFASQNLTNSDFREADLRGADFRAAKLTNANFNEAGLTGANLTGADMTGADVRGAFLYSTTSSGFTAAQLYSTASYQAHNLTGIGLGGNDLSGWNFAGQRLTSTIFTRATLTGADLTAAHVHGSASSDPRDSVRGANFSQTTSRGFTAAQLYSTASYQAHDLAGIDLSENDLTGWNFSGQNLNSAALWNSNLSQANLTNANFRAARLSGANFSGADVRGAYFRRVNDNGHLIGGITQSQLYSTASYQAHDLTGIGLRGIDLSGWNFAGQKINNADFSAATLTDADFNGANLTNAYFGGATLTGANLSQANLFNAIFYAVTLTDANFTAADARGAYLNVPAGAITTNLIRPDGHIDGLDLDVGGMLAVRDYDGAIPIVVDQHLAMAPGGTLRMVFEADAWDSTISFAPGIPVTLGGTLELTFADDVNLASQLGRTFDVFDWTGVTPTGQFTISSPYAWDLSNLYTTGQITLTAIPEPSAFALAALGLLSLITSARRPHPNQTI